MIRPKLLMYFIVLLVCSNAVSADLCLIKIDNQEKVEIATRLCGHAYARIGEQFLVNIESNIQDSLRVNSLECQTIIPDADITSFSLIRSRRPGGDPSFDPSRFGRSLMLDNNLFLSQANPASVASSSEGDDVFANGLDEFNVFFSFTPSTSTCMDCLSGTYPEDTLASLISQDSLYAYTKRMEDFYTRHIASDSIIRARDWIVSKFTSWGYTDVTTPVVSYGGRTLYNIKVVKPGYAEPDKVIVIGGHYDSYNPSTGNSYAPGADDDASGVAAAMEIARVLANVQFRKTIIFMPFTAEEQGLVGSRAAAVSFKNAGTKVEIMFNNDMIGYTTNTYDNINLSSGPVTAYRDFEAQTARRVTSLIPDITAMGSSSDHYGFYEQGYSVVDCIESDFNTPGWHTSLDKTTQMDFPYMTQVVKMNLASMAVVANSGYPLSVDKIVDVGDGDKLEVYFSQCDPSYTYKLFYGTAPHVYIDSVDVPQGACSYTVSGLNEGAKYYFAVFGTPSDGHRALWGGEMFETPLMYPRTPTSFVAVSDLNSINLEWDDNKEGDFAYYNLYRKFSSSNDYDLYQTGITTSTYTDNGVMGRIEYEYYVTSVDADGHESQPSASKKAFPATFDGGVLVVDEFLQDYTYFPDQAHRAAFYDTVMNWLPHGIVTLDSAGDTLSRSTAGRYSSIIWDDDDVYVKLLNDCDVTLNWYLDHTTNMFVCGNKTVTRWATPPIPSSHILNSEFGVTNYTNNPAQRFSAAIGQNGWPSIEWDQTRKLRNLYDFPMLTPGAGAEVILRNDSPDDNPIFEGQPIGVAYNGPHGKRVIIAVPMYFLTTASSNALMAKVLEYFGETSRPITGGDIDSSGSVDLSDLSLLVSYLLSLNPSLPNYNGADVDHSCDIDIMDLSILVSYLTTGSPALQEGCVTP
jgi:hypothetical protein